MFALRNEFSSILPKSIDAETSQSKTDQVFMILTLRNLGLEFENIWEQILIGSVVPTFVEVFARLLRHSSIMTMSLRSESSPDTFVMISQSHSRGHFRGGCSGPR